MTEQDIRKQICEVGVRMYQRNMIAANDGNISVKISDNEYICTPTMISKGFMTPEILCKVNSKGEVIEDNGYKPSSEIKMHMRVYERRPDVNSVVHAHPIYATSFAVIGQSLTEPVLPEAVISLGWVPLAKYGTPGTYEIPDACEEYLQDFDGVLLENHGALTYSTDLNSAFMKMETIEYYAQLLYQARVLGQPQTFNSKQVETLYDIRRKMNIGGKHPGLK